MGLPNEMAMNKFSACFIVLIPVACFGDKLHEAELARAADEFRAEFDVYVQKNPERLVSIAQRSVDSMTRRIPDKAGLFRSVLSWSAARWLRQSDEDGGTALLRQLANRFPPTGSVEDREMRLLIRVDRYSASAIVEGKRLMEMDKENEFLKLNMLGPVTYVGTDLGDIEWVVSECSRLTRRYPSLVRLWAISTVANVLLGNRMPSEKPRLFRVALDDADMYLRKASPKADAYQWMTNYRRDLATALSSMDVSDKAKPDTGEARTTPH
jgi:hypothetical protein